MRPQRKPFVVEIKKNRCSRTKSSLEQATHESTRAQKGAGTSVGLTFQRRDRG